MPSAPDRRDAADAAEFSAGYGLVLDDWQLYVIDCWLRRRRDGQWAAPRIGLSVPRQNGKTAMLEVRELFGMVMLGEKILHTAHEVKTARKAFSRLLEFFDNPRRYPELHGLVSEIRRANGQEAIVLANGASVEFVARSKGSARGFTVDVLVCDESQEFSDDKLAALLPTISAAPQGNPQTIMVGTPPSPVMNGEVFTRMRMAGLAGKEKRLCWLEWSGESVEDANPALGYRLGMETIEDERASMDAETFRRERCGKWDDVGGAAIFGSAWPDCSTTEDRPAPSAIGAAVSLDHAWGSIAAAGVRDGAPHVDAVQRRRGDGWLVDELARIQSETGAVVAINGKGPASDLINDLEDAGVRLEVADLDDYIGACESFYRRTQDGTMAHSHTTELDDAVRVAGWREIGERRAFGHKNSAGDISMLEAAALAAWAAVTAYYDPLESVL